MCDYWCHDRFTYTFYPRNKPAPKKYIKQGLSPLHSRCLWLFDQLKDKHYRCWNNNLYTSLPYIFAAINHPKVVFIEGVCQKGKRGLLSEVLQEEVKNKQLLEAVVGTVKVATLCCEESKGHTIITTLVYDTKPVHMLSSITEEVKWVVKERKLFNKAENKHIIYKHLRLNLIDQYNNGMGDVDGVDQLRGSYRPNI